MPCSRTAPATNKGVSDEKVVATMDVPAIYHGKERPATKKSAVLSLAFFVKSIPITTAATT